MKSIGRAMRGKTERGQVLPILALGLVMLMLFLALAIDLGWAYVTRANLSKAVDAAALQGMRNLSSGTATATTLAQQTFAANYHVPGSGGTVPVPTITFPTDPVTGQTTVQVTASTSMNTFFAKVIPSLSTVTVGSSGTAARSKVVLSLVLDRSNSMNNNGGAAALPPAVGYFVGFFMQNYDQLAMVSFASDAVTSQSYVALTSNFQTAITNAANNISFNGATFSYGGLQLGKNEIDGAGVTSTSGQVKAAVFFTDGIANTNQDNLSCPGYPLVNYGGNAPSEGNGVWFMNINTGATLPGNYQGQCYITSGGDPSCCNAPGFPSQQYGVTESYTTTNITSEAQYRTEQLANTMRSEAVPTVIYAIGLSDATHQSSINVDFLNQLANTPSSSTYNANQPSGMVIVVTSCPGTNCQADMQAAFKDIANAILLRLSK